MHISQKRVEELRSKLETVLAPDLLTTTMELVCETFQWSPEKYAELIARSNKAAKELLAKKKAQGLPTYSEAHKRYYHAHKEEISQRRAQQRLDKRGGRGDA
jgi:hypothetical protein